MKNSEFKSYLCSNVNRGTLSKRLSALLMVTCLMSSISVTAATLNGGKNTERNKKVVENLYVRKNEKKVRQQPIGRIDNLEKSKELQCLKDVKSENSNEIGDNLLNPKEKATDKVSKGSLYGITASSASTQKYSMASLNKMSYDQLIDLIVTLQWDDITDLFKYNKDAYEFYSDKNRVQALVDAISDRGSRFTTDNDMGIPTLVEVLRSGFYLGFYNDQLSYMNEEATKEKCIPAILATQKNPNFKLGTKDQDEVITSIGLLISNTTCNVEIINKSANILKQYNDNFDTYIRQNSKGTAIFKLMDGIQYDIDGYAYKKDFKSSPWYHKIDNYIEELVTIALKGNVTEDNKWLLNNGISRTGTLSKYHTNSNRGNQVLTQALKKYPYLGELYFQALQQIEDNYNGVDADGNKLDIDKIKEQAKQHYLPNKYSFDDGKIMVKTGDKVAREKVQRLYWASKEVQAQFFRYVGNSKALENGHVDDVLTIAIYNSPDEYKMNTLLNGISTDNGGIYIEGTGTFFTYERTEEQSIYTLEELFRHEFTHYLQGRYAVPGMWGDSDLYENDRLTWYEEGGAEMFAGSTRTEGIKARKSIIGNFVNTKPAQRYTLSKTVHSKYGTWDFYNYSCALMHYMYEKDQDMFNTLTDNIMKNNVSGYDSYIAQISKNAELNNNYQNHMEELVGKYDTLNVPLVSDDYMKDCSPKNISDIQKEIESIAPLKDSKITQSGSDFFNTFEFKGVYTGAESQGKIEDKKLMNKEADEILTKLQEKSWNGYNTVTCYFTNYRVNAENKFEFDVCFAGKLSSKILDENKDTEKKDTEKKDTENKDKDKEKKDKDKEKKDKDKEKKDKDKEKKNNTLEVKVNGPYKGVKKKAIRFSSEGTKSLNGKKVTYLWNFGDGETSDKKNPKHIYNEVGEYSVTLTVKNNKGVVKEETTTVTIVDKNKPKDKSKDKPKDKPSKDKDVITAESEPNNTFETASGPICSDVNVVGNVTSEDEEDYFYFDVISQGDVEITVDAPGGPDVNWLLYKESDLNNYMGYANDPSGKLKGSYKLSPGRYYLSVYMLNGVSSQYTINVKGSIGNAQSKNDGKGNNSKKDYLTKEIETNNDFKTANGPVLGNTNIQGHVDSEDNADMFYFDVITEGDVNIKLLGNTDKGINWLLYKEDDQNNYIGYGQSNNNEVSDTCKLQVGRYYLRVYQYGDSKVDYTINITGSVENAQ